MSGPLEPAGAIGLGISWSALPAWASPAFLAGCSICWLLLSTAGGQHWVGQHLPQRVTMERGLGLKVALQQCSTHLWCSCAVQQCSCGISGLFPWYWPGVAKGRNSKVAEAKGRKS